MKILIVLSLAATVFGQQPPSSPPPMGLPPYIYPADTYYSNYQRPFPYQYQFPYMFPGYPQYLPQSQSPIPVPVPTPVKELVPLSPLEAAVIDMKDTNKGHSEQYFYGRNLRNNLEAPSESSADSPAAKPTKSEGLSRKMPGSARLENMVGPYPQTIPQDYSQQYQYQQPYPYQQQYQLYQYPQSVAQYQPTSQVPYYGVNSESFGDVGVKNSGVGIPLNSPFMSISKVPYLEENQPGFNNKPFSVNKRPHYEVYLYD